MCGIVYCRNKRGSSATRLVIKRYRQQQNRGRAGYGFYLPDTDRLTHNVKEAGIIRQLWKHEASEILFHHRIPTSTKNVHNACHPFSTKDFFDRNYVVVHNGIISNDDELRKAHRKLKIKYVSEQDDKRFNDSEALAWDIALTLEGKQKKLLAKGSMAFIAFVRSANGKPYRLYWGRNSGSPLTSSENTKEVVIASESQEQSGAVEVPTDTLFWYNYANGSYGQRPMVFEPTPPIPITIYKYEPNLYYKGKAWGTSGRYKQPPLLTSWQLSPEADDLDDDLRLEFTNRTEAILEIESRISDLESKIAKMMEDVYGENSKGLYVEEDIEETQKSVDLLAELSDWYDAGRDWREYDEYDNYGVVQKALTSKGETANV